MGAGPAKPWAPAMPYLLHALRAYASSHPGVIRAYARSGRTIVPSVLHEYGAYLGNPVVLMLLAPWRDTIRRIARDHATPIVEDMLQSLRGEPGELGETARTYPNWVRAELQALTYEVGRRV